MKKISYADLAALAEDERIALIIEKVREGLSVGFIVESTDNKAKGNRYLEKIQKALPPLKIDRSTTGAQGVEFIRVRLL